MVLAPEMTPLKVNVPLSVLAIVVAPVVAIVPLNEADPVPVKAPVPPTPVPLIEMGFAPTETLLMLSAAPELTVVVKPVLPNADALAANKVPALTVLPL